MSRIGSIDTDKSLLERNEKTMTTHSVSGNRKMEQKGGEDGHRIEKSETNKNEQLSKRKSMGFNGIEREDIERKDKPKLVLSVESRY